MHHAKYLIGSTLKEATLTESLSVSDQEAGENLPSLIPLFSSWKLPLLLSAHTQSQPWLLELGSGLMGS